MIIFHRSTNLFETFLEPESKIFQLTVDGVIMGSGQSAPLFVEEELSLEPELALTLLLLTAELNVRELNLRLKIAILKLVQV